MLDKKEYGARRTEVLKVHKVTKVLKVHKVAKVLKVSVDAGDWLLNHRITG